MHTKEPWIVAEIDDCESSFDIVKDGWFIASTHDGVEYQNNAYVNARRIVACVNACAGIYTEFLEGWAAVSKPTSPQWDSRVELVNDLEQQRDELLSALRELTVRAENEIVDPCDVPEIVNANAVLAKADLTK